MNKSLIGGKEMIKSNNINFIGTVLEKSSALKSFIKKPKSKISNCFKITTPSPNEPLDLDKEIK